VTSISDNRLWAVDTSVAVAALDAQHGLHVAARAVVIARLPVLSGHAAIEAFSVLTRLPGPLRVSYRDARRALGSMFGSPCWLGEVAQQELFDRLENLGVVGGGVYDALVGEAARANNRVLLTNDARALRTYELLGVDFEMVEARAADR
jgi:predicted nucleic acid-binding protein